MSDDDLETWKTQSDITVIRKCWFYNVSCDSEEFLDPGIPEVAQGGHTHRISGNYKICGRVNEVFVLREMSI